MYELVIHGGAGAIPKDLESRRAAYLGALEDALAVGIKILSDGGASTDAVCAAVRLLEDCALFNAGRGAALAQDGTAILSASIMEGRGSRVGAVAGLRYRRNPIQVARSLMESSSYVFLVGQAAEEFAQRQGFDHCPNSDLVTEIRQEELEESLKSLGAASLAEGTVGAVARDTHGNLAAATSTGGATGQLTGRVGDSPIIGAGTFARNGVGAVSATGQGEFFIRTAAASRVISLMEFAGSRIDNAVSDVLRHEIGGLGGKGGIIAIDAGGQVFSDFTTACMFRAQECSDGRREVSIF